MTQSTMLDLLNAQEDVFNGVRPSVVVDEASADGTFSHETLVEQNTSDATPQIVKASQKLGSCARMHVL